MIDLLKNINSRWVAKHTYSTKGDIEKIEYYESYDGIDYTNKRKDVAFAYTRNAIWLIDSIIETHSLYSFLWDEQAQEEVEGLIRSKQYPSIIPTVEESDIMNQESRTRLVGLARKTLFEEVDVPNAKAFLAIIGSEPITTYIGGQTQPLLTAISSSTESYMTAGTIKADLDTILNISY